MNELDWVSSQQIATALNLHPSSVWNLQVCVLRDGAALLEQPGRRTTPRSSHLGREEALLAGFCFAVGQGGLVEASSLRAAYEEQVEQAVAKSTLYGMLVTFNRNHPLRMWRSSQIDEKRATWQGQKCVITK